MMSSTKTFWSKDNYLLGEKYDLFRYLYFNRILQKNKENSRLFALAEENSSFSVSIITTFEVYCGVKTKEQKIFWDNLFAEFTQLSFGEKANAEAITIYKNLKKRSQLIEVQDILIAATAKANNINLATNNFKHFDRIDGLQLI